MANWPAKPASTTETALQKWQVIVDTIYYIIGPDIFLSHNIFIKYFWVKRLVDAWGGRKEGGS